MSANPIQHKHFHLGITRHELHNHIPATGTGIQIRIQHNGAGSLTPGQSRGQILQNFELRVHVAPPAILAIHLIPLIHAQDLEFCLPPLRPRRNVPNLIRNFLRKHLQIMNAAVREIFRFGLAGDINHRPGEILARPIFFRQFCPEMLNPRMLHPVFAAINFPDFQHTRGRTGIGTALPIEHQ